MEADSGRNETRLRKIGQTASNGSFQQGSPSKQGLGLALILHELATNASKYGSLSRPDGKLSVAWHVEPTGGAHEIRLHWRESGGPPLPPDTDKGFETTLMERSCACELKGTAEPGFNPEGLEVDISFPGE